MKQEKIRILFLGEKVAGVATVQNTLTAFQYLVRGFVEQVAFAEGIVCLCNEDARVYGYEKNPYCKLFYGRIAFVGWDGHEYKSLDTLDIYRLCLLFHIGCEEVSIDDDY